MATLMILPFMTVEEPTTEILLKDMFPWLIAAAVGVILLIVAGQYHMSLIQGGNGNSIKFSIHDQLFLFSVILLVTAQRAPFTFPYNSQDFNIPHYQGSIRVKSVEGQDLRYITELRQIGSSASRALRQKLEPKVSIDISNRIGRIYSCPFFL